jgi:hypothetical protein
MKQCPLLEITYSDAPRVDRDAGVIRGVRILGRVSRNGREYSPAALGQAARLYEGLGVNLNHPDRPQSPDTRAVEDGFGWLESIDIRADGVYGDLHYFRAHPQAEVIVEAAIRNPRRFGLSHHAEGSVVQHQGRSVVESIATVRSVDLVQNPATNKGLFESETTGMNRTIQQILEDAGGAWPLAIAPPELAASLSRLIDLPESADRERRIDTALRSLLLHLLEDESLEIPARFDHAVRLLEARLAGEKPAPTSADPATLTGILERIERIETHARCRALLESANRASLPERLDELAALPTDQERARLIETWPARDPDRPARERPAMSRPLHEPRGEGVKFPEDLRAFVAAIR